ncbi:Nuclear pore assembly and biogenesis protein APQ12 [Penicillium odoratum]|uniref:Nuclear pore assembly and biogenesis protein APQ12 n=1 Tax=Penicillium odoratum TaxID=1167516 RepID=UPI002548A757|nr:Nuclear pore assembly and biogenesis protein APQ12 [Penicillium odoratum]KAJ5777326.1 Nuclear pore assembly and biogenesis protein APQ12 [Penicillium odoratum]
MDLLPENLQSFLQHPTISFLRNTTQGQVTAQLANLRSAYVQPYIIDPLSTFLTSTSAAAMPDLLSVFMLVVILFISLKILDYARRLVMFWVMLAFRLVFWGSLIGLGLYVYQVGVENAGRDLGWLWGVTMGFVEDFHTRSGSPAGGWVPGAGSGSGSGKQGNRGGFWG